MSVQRQIDKLIAIRATQWYEAISSGNAQLSSDEFRRWISESPRHVDAFMVVAGQAPLIREALQSSSVDVQAVGSERSGEILSLDLPVALASRESVARQKSHEPRRQFRWTKSVGWASAAAGSVALAVFLWYSPTHGRRLETTVGEQRVVTLADGSVVNLNALSAVDVRLLEHARNLRLLQGEAIFKVAHDKQRPFRVYTPTAVIRAVGTEFAVSTGRQGTLVTVLAGKVVVAPNDGSSYEGPSRPGSRTEVTAVAAGQEARVARGGAVRFEPNADVTTSVAWLKRKLVFRRTLLEDVVSEVNRYNDAVRLRIEGVTPGVYRFNGTFDANDPLSLADLLAREPGLTVERRDGEIVIRNR